MKAFTITLKYVKIKRKWRRNILNKFDYMAKYGYEQLVYFYDKETGLKGITCIHDTTLGPALGGTRLWNYASEEEAVEDVLRLARGMTYKNAVAGLNLGGGKTVLIGDPDKVKTEAYWRAFGRYVQSLNGRYITAEDVNTNTNDMDYIATLGLIIPIFFASETAFVIIAFICGIVGSIIIAASLNKINRFKRGSSQTMT
jgi:glutamate dehydrogenase/leucine dehydrogenase